MNFGRLLLVILSIAFHLAGSVPNALRAQPLAELPPLPVRAGVAGPYCGLVNEQLVVAGGANFPAAPPWAGGIKEWHADVYVLDSAASEWRVAGELPRPWGYGVSLTLPEGLLLIGGSDAERHYSNVYLLEQITGELQFRELAPLPIPLANMAGALIGDQIYVVGGSTEPGERTASRRVFSTAWADLRDSSREVIWTERTPLPGPGRLLPGIAVVGRHLYVFGGAAIIEGPEKTARQYLRSGYRLAIPNGGRAPTEWQAIADLPAPVVAPPNPSPNLGSSHFLVCGGDDGSQVGIVDLADHPGFSGTCWLYHVITDKWVAHPSLRHATVATSVVPWPAAGSAPQSWVIPSGEVRPGVRTPSIARINVTGTTPQFGLLNYAMLVLYLAVVFGVGLAASGRIATTRQFFRADQTIPWWAAGLSIFATMLSSITFMSIPAQGFSVGWNLFVGSVYVLLTPLVIFVYLPFYRRLDVTSAYEYLERRFNVGIRVFASLQFLLFQLGRTAVVLFLPSLALATVAGINLPVSIVAVGTLCVLYTMLGGMKAVIWTDAVQAMILLVGAGGALAAIIARVPGGVSEVLTLAEQHGKFFQTLPWSADLTIATGWAIMIGNVFSSLFSYTASQDVVQRYLTTPDERSAARAIVVNAVLAPLAQGIFFCIGTGLFAFYWHYPERLTPGLANDGIFPFFVVQELPAGLAGLIIAAIFAAAQSTISSSLNSFATAGVTDFYRRFRTASTEAEALRWARYLTLGAGVVGIVLALLLAQLEQIRSLWEVFLMVLSLFGGSVSGLFVLGMFTTRANGPGALVGALTSSIVVLMMYGSGVLFWWFSVAGVGVCVVVGYVVSGAFPPPRNLAGLTVFTLPGRTVPR